MSETRASDTEDYSGMVHAQAKLAGCWSERRIPLFSVMEA